MLSRNVQSSCVLSIRLLDSSLFFMLCARPTFASSSSMVDPEMRPWTERDTMTRQGVRGCACATRLRTHPPCAQVFGAQQTQRRRREVRQVQRLQADGGGARARGGAMAPGRATDADTPLQRPWKVRKRRAGAHAVAAGPAAVAARLRTLLLGRAAALAGVLAARQLRCGGRRLRGRATRSGAARRVARTHKDAPCCVPCAARPCGPTNAHVGQHRARFCWAASPQP